MTVIPYYVGTKDDSDFFGSAPPPHPLLKFGVRQRNVHIAESRLALSKL